MNFAILWLMMSVMFSVNTSGYGRGSETGLVARTASVGKNTYGFQVYIPAGLEAQRNVPVLLFLHGIGQRGQGGFVHLTGGAGAFAKTYLDRMPAIIVLPQCREGRYWHDKDMEKMAIAALDQVVAEFGGDTSRLYVVGVSMGGYGAWHLAAEYPHKFAALVPVCGGSPLRTADRFAPIARKVGHTPVWVFHGAADRIVPVSESRNMVAAMKAMKGNVRYSEYPGVGHNVWMNVLAETELLPWVLSQRLDKR